VKRILHLTDQGITQYLIQGGRLLGERFHAADDEGRSRLESDLKRAPAVPTRLLLDITEEEFHQERVPHVFHHDQQKILERRRRQRFHGGRWSHWEHQGREDRGRKDDIFLLSGITREEVVQFWLEPVMAACVDLERMTSVPLLAPRLYRRMRIRHSHVLFVSHGKGGGIRQTYLHEGRLKASRLAPTPAYREKDYVSPILQEVRRMKQFLNTAHFLPYDETLHLYLLGSHEIISLLGRETLSGDGIHLHNYDIHALAQRFHFKGLHDSRYADAFYSLLAATDPRAPSYLTPAERRGHYHHLARRAMGAAAALVMVSGLGLVTHQILGASAARKELARLEQEIGRYEAGLARLKAQRPASEPSGFLMQDAVRFHDRLSRIDRSPFEWFPVVGQALLEHPDIRLTRVSAKLMEGETDSLEGREGRSLDGPVESDTGPRAEVRLEGEIAGEGRSFRALHQEFMTLIRRLRNSPEFAEVRVDRWPVEIRTDRSLVLEGDGGHADGPKRFAMTLVGRALL